MNWIDIAWPVMGGACLMLSMVHGWAWIRRPKDVVQLLFSLACLSVAVLSALERMLMQTRDPAAYGELLRWAHVPGAVMFITLALFVHLRYRSSRAWLCYAAIALRVLSLVLNFGTGVNINYAAIDELRLVTLVGGVETAVPVGQVNPWMVVGQAGIVVFLAYLVDTMVREWRACSPQERWSLVRVCGGIALFVLLVNSWRVAVVMGAIPAPDALVPAFLCVVVVMGHELVVEFLRSADLSVNLDQTRARLRESEFQAELAARAGELGLWAWDVSQRRYWVTELGLRLLGFAPGEAFDEQDLLRRIHPDDRGVPGRALAQALHEGGDYRADYRITTHAGALRHLSVRGQLQPSGSGPSQRIYGVISDVTERLLQEERFALAVEASPTAMLMTRQDGTITLANRQTEVVFGYPREALLGMSMYELLPTRVAAGREQHGCRRDGTEVLVEVALNPIRIGDEQHVLASIVDISERRRLESEAARHRDELAHLSRVALLAELSGSLAHELNQPLTAILSNAQAATRFLAMDPPELGEVAESLANIVESDKRAGEVIRRLRAMLRKEAADHREIDLNEVVADVMRIIRSDLLNRSIEAVLALAPALPRVWGDKVQLQQVLLNLVTNGSDAMSGLPGPRRMVIRTRALADGGVEVSVSDVGTGIPGDQLETIFQPFVSSKADGMGLGLAVCTSIIESHRGRLWASNNPGPGATVHFSLPAGDAAHPEGA